MEIDFAAVLGEVIQQNASDLHLTVGSPPMVRVRGELRGIEGQPQLSSKDTRDIVYGILSNDQRKRLEEHWQVDFSYSVPRMGRFRVNAYMQRASVGAAFRLIPSEIKSVDQLGLPTAVHEFVKKPRGFVLVTGPTGSGKTTSLAAMIRSIVCAVSCVCNVAKTRWPVSAAVSAVEIVSRSLISPTRITSGS